MKRIISVILAAIMLISLSIPTFATKYADMEEANKTGQYNEIQIKGEWNDGDSIIFESYKGSFNYYRDSRYGFRTLSAFTFGVANIATTDEAKVLGITTTNVNDEYLESNYILENVELRFKDKTSFYFDSTYLNTDLIELVETNCGKDWYEDNRTVGIATLDVIIFHWVKAPEFTTAKISLNGVYTVAMEGDYDDSGINDNYIPEDPLSENNFVNETNHSLIARFEKIFIHIIEWIKSLFKY